MPKLNFLGYLSLLILVGCGGGSGSTSNINEPNIQQPAPVNNAPAAHAGGDATVMGGTVVPLDGSSSSDEDGDELAYTWTIDSDATAYFVAEDGTLTETMETATGKLLIPASQAGQDIMVSLEISDGSETASDTVTYSVGPCTEKHGYIFTGCIDPAWQGPMAWDVNFLDVTDNFGYYDSSTDNHVRWSLVESDDNNRGRVIDITFNKENWNGSFRILPAGSAAEPNTRVDFSIYASGNLVFDLLVVEPTDAEIYITAECDFPCDATPRKVNTTTDGAWTTVSIPLAELNGMNWSNTSIPFAIHPEWGAQTGVHLQVDNIRFERAPCIEEENVIFNECLGPLWYTLAAVDDDTLNEFGDIQEYRSGETDKHVQWREEFSGTPERGNILAVQFTNDATNGHFYVRTKNREASNNLSSYINGALALDINIQDYGFSTDGIIVRVDTWWDGATSDEILLSDLAVGEWTTIEIPVSDLLAKGGLDLSEVHAGFSIWPAGNERGDQQGVKFQLDNIRWETQLSE